MIGSSRVMGLATAGLFFVALGIRAAGGEIEELEALVKAHRESGDRMAEYLCLADLVKLRPGHAEALTRLGEIDFERGRKRAAVQAWIRAYQAAPTGRAKGLLAEHQPEALRPPTMLEDVDEVLEIYRFLQDFRRQREVERALADYTTRKALGGIGLGPENSASLIASLHANGYLARPGGPPSGEGEYRTGPDGRVFSTVFGSPREPKSAHPGLANPMGFDAPAELVLRAIETRRPEGVEFGLPQLSDQDLEKYSSRIVRGILAVDDPWATDSVVARLSEYADSHADSIPLLFAPVLRRVVQKGEPRQRWLAMAWLYKDGQRDLPPLSPRLADELLRDASAGLAPPEAVEAMLFALGGGAEDFLLKAMESGSEVGWPAVLDALSRHGGKRSLKFLIDGAAGKDLRFARAAGAVRAAVKELARGEEIGATPQAWRAWYRRKYGG